MLLHRINKKQYEILLNTIIGFLFIFIFGLVLYMSVSSKYNAHPDEFAHVKAVEYYQNHWLPPSVNDPDIRDSFSVYGNSRLLDFDLYYFLNGKFSVLVGNVSTNSIFSMRLFNNLLFFILMILFLKENWKFKPFFLILLISPQIWYLFSYVNSDAFALFLSFIILYEVAKKNSLFNKFLLSSKTFGNSEGALLMAGLLALQLLSKSNYYLTLIFFTLLMISFFIRKRADRKKIISKYILLIGLTLLFLAPRVLYDVKLHGMDRGFVISEYKEQYAKDQFKKSNITTESSYFGYHLKDKGVKYTELFSKKWSWHKVSFKSFVGVYGYMSILGTNFYYYLMLLQYIILFGYITFLSFSNNPNSNKIFTLMVYALLLLMAIISTHFSWSHDFQPQGRYLFPVLGIFGYWFYRNYDISKSLFFKITIIAIALVSCYSFLFVALSNIPKV